MISRNALTAVAIALPAFALAGCETVAEVVQPNGYIARLTGAAEVPGPGDPDATGSAEVTFVSDQLCYEVDVRGMDPATAAHIHSGGPGVAGPPIITLEAPTDGSSSGCMDISDAQRAQIDASPANHYVNVHNAEFPQGAVRGQLQP